MADVILALLLDNCSYMNISWVRGIPTNVTMTVYRLKVGRIGRLQKSSCCFPRVREYDIAQI